VIRSSRCPPLRPRGGHLFCSILFVLLAVPIVRLPAQEESYRDSFLLGLGWGWLFPLTQGFAPGAGAEGIESGPLIDELVQKIAMHRIVAEHLAIDIDHDAGRTSGGGIFGGDNVYSLRWQGEEDAALRSLGIGNLQRSIHGSSYNPIDEGSSESFALTAEARLGPVTLEGLARYGSAVEGRRRFRGSRFSIEADLADVSYARARFYLLPDAGIDEAGLKVAKSSPTGTITIGGRRYALLSRGTDWQLDNAGARLTLRRSLAPNEELIITYTKGGTRVGELSLGLNAIVDEDGSRYNFNAFDARWDDEYFGSESGTRWLFLRKEGISSYWELRNTFYLEDLEEGRVPEQVSVQILHTSTLAPNPAYDDVADDFRVSPAEGTISFEFTEAGMFYPRPFPGEQPYPAVNPFASDNPMYGSWAYTPLDASVTTARIRYILSTETYRLDPSIVPGSVRVTVDGRPLPSSSWTVDPVAGMITFAPGVIGPQSDVEVVYRWNPFAGAGREFVAAVAAAVGEERRGARNLLALTLPIPDAPAPHLGEEKPTRLADSIDVSASFGAAPDQIGFAASVSGSGAIALSAADMSGVAIVADMEDDRRIGVSLSEGAWTLAPKSTLLPALVVPVPLGDRGEVRYENLWEDQPLGGSVLHDVLWDNSGNPQFAYAAKAGPYNSADSPPGSTSNSLVLDVAFPAGSTGAYAAVSTVLPGIDAGGAQRLSVWLRGVGVAGHVLHLYAEALGNLNEQLDADIAIDGETSPADEGFAITPIDGDPTMIGTNRHGESNGRLDSEDRNGNGVLDIPAEIGEVLGGAQLNDFPIGDSDWQEVTLDIAALVNANPGTFRNLRGIRLTVVPVTNPTAADVTGRILVGGFAFSGSALTSSSTSLSVQEVTPEEDNDLAAHPFAAAHPDVYRKLHGSDSYREDHGIADKALACTLMSDLNTGESALAELALSPPADVSAWKLLQMYVLIPAGNPPWNDAGFLVGLESGSDLLQAEVPATAFRVGWNEVSLLLESPWTVAVNGTASGSSLAGKSGVVQRITKVRLGLKANTAIIPQDLRFLTDEWHLAQARLAVDAAAKVEATMGWRGVAMSAGDFPLVSDPFLSAAYEHRSGSFLDRDNRVEDRWNAGLTALAAGSLSVSFDAGQAYDRPAEKDPDVEDDLQKGSTDLRSMVLVLDTGKPWIPVLEHRWDRSRAVEQDLVISAPSLKIARDEADRESLSLSERLEQDGLVQWLTFSRTWNRNAQELLDATTGTATDAAGARGLLETGQAGLSWTWQEGRISLEATRDRIFGTPYDPGAGDDPGDGPWSYFHRLGGLFDAPGDTLVGASEQTLRDHFRLELERPRTRYLGASLSLDAGYSEYNVDPSSGSRDTSTRDSLSLSLPVSPDGKSRILLTPEASVMFTGTCRSAQPSIKEAELLFTPWPVLLLVPLTWSRSLEHDTVNPFVGDSQIEAVSNALAARLAMTARISEPDWYLPSQASISLKDDTANGDNVRSQKRTISLSLHKEAAFAHARSLTWDAGADYTRDFAAKVRSLSLLMHAQARLSEVLGGTLTIDQSSGWNRDRQSIGDPMLSLIPGMFPDVPDLVIAPQPGQDTFRNSLSFLYEWSREGNPKDPDIEVQRTTHTEKLSLESVVTWVEPGAVSSTTPFRVTFEHLTEIDVTDTFTLGIRGKLAGGVERRTGMGDHVYLYGMGFELGVTGKLRF
jgi:hypothetical protein